jgi:hypothetical protein
MVLVAQVSELLDPGVNVEDSCAIWFRERYVDALPVSVTEDLLAAK